MNGNGELPLVGQPLAVHEISIVASITCRCRPENTPMLITGLAIGAICPHCQHTYAIMTVAFDRRKGLTATGSVGLIQTS